MIVYYRFFLSSTHGLRTPGEEIAFTARPKIHSNSQIFRYSRSIFCLPHRPKFSGFFDLCLHWVYLIFIHKDFTRFQNQSFWSGSQVVLHLLLSRSWMLFALEKLAAAAALDLALPSHNTMGSKYSWIRICDFKFLWFHEKNASDLSKAESFKKYYRAKNPRICSPNFLSYFSSRCKVCIFLISTVILAFFGLFWS